MDRCREGRSADRPRRPVDRRPSAPGVIVLGSASRHRGARTRWMDFPTSQASLRPLLVHEPALHATIVSVTVPGPPGAKVLAIANVSGGSVPSAAQTSRG